MEEIVPVVILVTYFGLMLLERIVPARPLPKVRRWYLKGLIFFVVVMVVSGVTPALVAAAFGELSPLGLASLGTLGGALVTILVSELLSYLMHRSFHTYGPLWRWVHQLHHSAERLDVPGAAFTSPAEVLVGGVIVTLATMLLGVTPDAAAIAGIFAVFNAIFQHANVKTPRWLGYLVQRPESHSVHHARGVHAYNYANLPLIDLLFGTFRNPESFVEEQGFWHGASSKIGAMLLGRDVTEPPPSSRAASGTRAVATNAGSPTLAS
jgi:sterol desaturase/sphingolipid hydroxylase (fatty acid hydroxylase superfamily)